MKIEIRGVIVPSDYDVDYLFSYIKRGVITPESRIRTLLDSAPKNQALDVYINSPGGSVFAGNEIIISLLAWKRETGQQVNITVGALAASMGANIAILGGDYLTLHSNSKIMFHGAWGGNIGGAGSMRDYAELLDKINHDVKLALMRKYGFSPDVLDEWFAEGREGWLSAEDAKKAGMTSDIIGDIDDMPETDSSIDAIFNETGMKIAALKYSKNYLNQTKGGTIVLDKILNKLKAKGLGEESDESIVMGFLDTLDISTDKEAIRNELSAELKAAFDTEKSGFVAQIANLEKERDEAKAQFEPVKAELDSAKKELKELQAKHTRLLGGGLGAPDSENSDSSDGPVELFMAKVGEYVEQGMDRAEATVKAQREHKELFADMLKAAKKK